MIQYLKYKKRTALIGSALLLTGLTVNSFATTVINNSIAAASSANSNNQELWLQKRSGFFRFSFDQVTMPQNIQDMGLLECDLPPIPLFASTQAHNHTVEKVTFLEKVGFQRVILARELSLEEIKEIRKVPEAGEVPTEVRVETALDRWKPKTKKYRVAGRWFVV